MCWASYLRAGSMPQLFIASPVHPPSYVIICVHHLVRQRVLEVATIPNLVGAQQDAMARRKPSRLPDDGAVLADVRRTPPADHVRLVQVAIERLDLLSQEAYRGRVRKQPVAVLLALLAVALLVPSVAILAIVVHAFGGHLVRQDLEVVHEPLDARVVARSRGVILEKASGSGGGFCGIVRRIGIR